MMDAKERKRRTANAFNPKLYGYYTIKMPPSYTGFPLQSVIEVRHGANSKGRTALILTKWACAEPLVVWLS